MTFNVFGSVLSFAVDRLVEFLHDLGVSGLRSFEVRINIVYEYCQALRLVPDLRGTGAPWARAIEHYPSITEMHLRAFYPPAWFAITVVLGETECFRQPNHRIGNI